MTAPGREPIPHRIDCSGFGIRMVQVVVQQGDALRDCHCKAVRIEPQHAVRAALTREASRDPPAKVAVVLAECDPPTRSTGAVKSVREVKAS